MARHLKPFQLLEINIISAQDLEQVSRKMRTYATAWVHPKRKLLTSVDSQGHNNPTWNDKFVFRVDEEFLRCDTSAVMIEIHAAHWFRDALVGSVRVLVGNLFPPTRPRPQHHHVGMRFAALQVRRPSGRPQGILNIGVTVLDSSMRSMPLYTLAASAVGYRDLIEEGHPHGHGGHDDAGPGIYPPMKPVLLRSRSECSFAFDDHSVANGSVISVSQNKPVAGKASSVISISEVGFPATNEKTAKKGKASSIIGGVEFQETPKDKGVKKGKSNSIIGAIIAKDPKPKEGRPFEPLPQDKEKYKTGEFESAVKLVSKGPKGSSMVNGNVGPKGSSIVNGKYVYGDQKAHSMWSDSEVGPSASVVAAAIARDPKYYYDDNQSSVLDGWSLDESVEGLKSKLERWRTELPPLYDRGGGGGGFSSYRSTSQHIRRHTEGDGGGLFSCFGNIYGYECQCVCGKPPGGKRSLSGRFQSPSASAGRSFR